MKILKSPAITIAVIVGGLCLITFGLFWGPAIKKSSFLEVPLSWHWRAGCWSRRGFRAA